MNGLDRIEHEPGQANAEAEPHTLDRLDRQMRHIEPPVAWKIEKGLETGAQSELTPFGYPVVDKSWADRLSPIEGEENLKEAGDRNYEGGRMETDVDEGPKGVQTDWPDITATSVEGDIICNKAISSAARLEGKFGKGSGERNAEEPITHPFPSNSPS